MTQQKEISQWDLFMIVNGNEALCSRKVEISFANNQQNCCFKAYSNRNSDMSQ